MFELGFQVLKEGNRNLWLTLGLNLTPLTLPKNEGKVNITCVTTCENVTSLRLDIR